MSVSIIIPYYNHGNFLHAAVQSALAASKEDIEIIIVNDGSRERHAATYLAAAQRLSDCVRIVEKENGGLSSARNTGLAMAQGDYIQFLDSDDTLIPGKIDRQIGHFAIRPDILVSVTNYYTSDEWMVRFDNNYDSIGRFSFSPASFLFLWERGFSIPIHSALIKKEVFHTVRFDETVAGKEDWIFWCSIAKHYPDRIAYCPINGAIYRLHGSGMTRSLDAMGESWLRAASAIQELFEGEHPEFREASEAWHRKFYEGRRLKVTDTVIDRGNSTSNIIAAEPRSHDESSPALQSALELLNKGDKAADEILLSFVVPIYNHASHLKSCLESIFEQSDVDGIEVIAIDDSSPDPAIRSILTEFTDTRIPFCFFRNAKNIGIAETQNLAAGQARGKYLAFVDCDDFVSKDAVALVRQAIATETADYYFSDRVDVDTSGRKIRDAEYGGYDWIKPSGNIKDDLLLGMVASHLKVIRRDLYLELGGSRAQYTGIQDWDLALRVAKEGTFSYIPKPLYFHRVHQSSVTSSAGVSQMWMTNCLRREAKAELGFARASQTSAIVSQFDHPEDTRAFLADIKRGTRLTFNSRGRPLDVKEIDLLREFNSMFDRIIVREPETAALMGYLWSESIIASQQ